MVYEVLRRALRSLRISAACSRSAMPRSRLLNASSSNPAPATNKISHYKKPLFLSGFSVCEMKEAGCTDTR